MNVHPSSTSPVRNEGMGSEPKAPIDLSATLQRIGHDHSLLRDLATFFVEDVPPLLAELKSAIPARAAGDVERAAHCLKGLASNFNAHAVQASAQQLEDAGRAAKLDGTEAMLTTLVHEVEIVTAALHREVLDAPA